MDITKIQSAGYNITYIAQPGEHGPRVLVDWRTPYSEQATRVLKATYPTYWETIKAYGYAHPEYISALNYAVPIDPTVMYSLIPELGYNRSMYNSAGGYIMFGYYHCTQDTNVTLDAKITVASGTYPVPLGMGDPYQLTKTFWLNSPTVIGYGYGGTSSLGVATITSARHKLELRYNAFYIDDSKVHEVAAKTFTNTSPTGQMTLFARDTGQSRDRNCQGIVWGIEVNEGESLVKKIIPFKLNGNMELLDLISGEIGTRVGTFTELIEEV